MDFQALTNKMLCIIAEWTAGNYACRIQSIENVSGATRQSIASVQERLGELESQFAMYPVPATIQSHVEAIPGGLNPVVSVTMPSYIDIKSVLPLIYTNVTETDPENYEIPVIATHWTQVVGPTMVIHFQILGEITVGEFQLKFTYQNVAP